MLLFPKAPEAKKIENNKIRNNIVHEGLAEVDILSALRVLALKKKKTASNMCSWLIATVLKAKFTSYLVNIKDLRSQKMSAI